MNRTNNMDASWSEKPSMLGALLQAFFPAMACYFLTRGLQNNALFQYLILGMPIVMLGMAVLFYLFNCGLFAQRGGNNTGRSRKTDTCRSSAPHPETKIQRAFKKSRRARGSCKKRDVTRTPVSRGMRLSDVG